LSNVVYGNSQGIVAYYSVARDNRVYHNTSVGIVARGTAQVLANTIYSNPVGIRGDSTYPYGIYTGTIGNNLIYVNTNQGVVLSGANGATVTNNTIYQPVGDAVRIQDNSSNVRLRNNILWVDNGYNLYVTSDSQQGFDSDYNLLRATGAGKLAGWGTGFGLREYSTLVDWRYELGRDVHSLTADPQLIDIDGTDNLLGYQNGIDYSQDDNFSVQSTSPTIDAGDPLSYYLAEPGPNGGRVNQGHTGNTAQATPSQSQLVQILSPNGLEKFENGQQVTIDWRSAGLTEQHTVALINAGSTSAVDTWLANQYQTTNYSTT
jgi:hypothetical protein